MLSINDNVTISMANDDNSITSSYRTEAEATIYQTLPVILNSTFVEQLADDILGFTGTTTQTEDLISITDGNKTFEMYKTCGSIWYADYTKLWNISYDPTLPNLATCKSIADAFIAQTPYCDVPQFSYFGSSNVTAYNPDTRETREKLLNININYGFELGGLSLGGLGATSSVTIGDGGEIIGFNWIKRDFVELQTELIINFQDVLTLHGISDYDSIEQELVYFHDSVGETQEYLVPIYEVEITKTDPISDEEYSFILYLPATSFSPKVTITDPIDEKTFTSSDNIEFDCSITDGTTPFTYNWESTIDGFMNNTKSFFYDGLSIATKQNSSVSHTIILTITDANGLTASDTITLTITRSTFGFGLEYLTILGLLGIGLFVLMNRKGSKRRNSLPIVLILISIFTMSSILQISYVKSIEEVVVLDRYHIETAYDDGIREVGVEWLCYSGGDYLPSSDDLGKRFYNKIGTLSNWNKNFIWGDNSAWEEDFKYDTAPGGGTDIDWIDSVDLALFSGHGNANGIQFMSNHDDTWLHPADARWGDGDLEWMALDACKTLQLEDKDGFDVFERWGGTLKGVHMICGFHTNANDVKDRGKKFAIYMEDGKTVKDSWFKAGKQTAGKKVWSAVLYASPSDDPWNPQTDDPANDHLHGYGYVCSDPTSPKWWVWIAVQC